MGSFRSIGRRVKKSLIDKNLINPVSQKGSRVIMYHSIDKPDIKPLNGLTICVDDFEEQLRYFQRKFQILSLEELFNGYADPNYFSIAITFDDGLQNNYRYAYPILEKYKIPATFFVTGLNEAREKYLWVHWFNNASLMVRKPVVYKNEIYSPTEAGMEKLKKHLLTMNDFGYEEKSKVMSSMLKSIPGRDEFNEMMNYWRLMSDDEIKEISQSAYGKIGSHAYWHNNLTFLNFNNALRELVDSKKYLEKITTKDIHSLAYPFGNYSRKLVEEAEKIGFHYQLAVNYNYMEDIEDRRLQKRVGIVPYVTPQYMSYVITKS